MLFDNKTSIFIYQGSITSENPECFWMASNHGKYHLGV
jgi:hypothetical protein